MHVYLWTCSRYRQYRTMPPPPQCGQNRPLAHRTVLNSSAVAAISANNAGGSGRGSDSFRFCVLLRATGVRGIYPYRSVSVMPAWCGASLIPNISADERR